MVRLRSLRVAHEMSLLRGARDSLVFDNARLDEVVPQLQRWFDMKVGIADPSLYDRRVTTRFSLESSGAALEAVCRCGGFDDRLRR